jgi:aryl-alcohol dehydrogenase-like predicted oxidoreductase
MQLGLGTATFGSKYGINNLEQVSLNEVKRILSCAQDNQIRALDTAQLYGKAEQNLGLCPSLAGFDIVTKLDSIESLTAEQTVTQFRSSLARLRQTQVHACLLHRANDLFDNTDLDRAKANFTKLTELKSLGLVDKIGVSVYHPSELDFILRHFKIDMVQLPLNVFDQRFLQNNLLQKAQQQNVEIHVRSAFLQGLLLRPLTEMPDYFTEWLDKIATFHQVANQLNCTPLQLALGFLKALGLVDKCIVGTNSLPQFEQLISQYQRAPELTGEDLASLTALSSNDDAFILPTFWPN